MENKLKDEVEELPEYIEDKIIEGKAVYLRIDLCHQIEILEFNIRENLMRAVRLRIEFL